MPAASKHVEQSLMVSCSIKVYNTYGRGSVCWDETYTASFMYYRHHAAQHIYGPLLLQKNALNDDLCRLTLV